jgi:hypothetical protein
VGGGEDRGVPPAQGPHAHQTRGGINEKRCLGGERECAAPRRRDASPSRGEVAAQMRVRGDGDPSAGARPRE